jgi:hypothetical protein
MGVARAAVGAKTAVPRGLADDFIAFFEMGDARAYFGYYAARFMPGDEREIYVAADALNRFEIGGAKATGFDFHDHFTNIDGARAGNFQQAQIAEIV